MKRRLILLACLVTSWLLIAPTASAASRFLIRLPTCEQTVYKIENKEKVSQTMSPDEYDAKATADPTFKETWTVTEVTTSGDCGVDEFFQLFASLATWGLSILGAVAVFFFMWGGFTLLIAGGRSEKVEEGKKILNGTFMGVIVVLTAWIIVNAYIIGFAGGKSIFPNSPFTRSGLGSTGSQCRASYLTNYSQTGCTGNDLHFGCADPTTGDGAVTKLQTLLAAKCPSVGAADGCFGRNTAYALWGFLASNGYQPIPENYRDVRGNAATLQRLLTDPTSKECSDAFGLTPVSDPADPSDQPASSGCCVPASVDARGSCIAAATAADCPVGRGTVPDYNFQSFACNTFPLCTAGCCIKYQPNGAKTCESCTRERCTTAGAVWQQGACTFSTNQCQSATLCS